MKKKWVIKQADRDDNRVMPRTYSFMPLFFVSFELLAVVTVQVSGRKKRKKKKKQDLSKSMVDALGGAKEPRRRGGAV